MTKKPIIVSSLMFILIISIAGIWHWSNLQMLNKYSNFDYLACNSDENCALTSYSINGCCSDCETFPINAEGIKLQEKWRKSNCHDATAYCATFKCLQTKDNALCVQNRCVKESTYLTTSAIGMKDWKICNELEGYYRSVCLINLAILLEDESICENIPNNKDERGACYHYLATIVKHDESLCKKAEDKKFDCYLNLAAYKNKPAICDELATDRDVCYKFVSETTTEFLQCENYSIQEEKENCYFQLIDSETTPFCERTGKQKEQCYNSWLYWHYPKWYTRWQD